MKDRNLSRVCIAAVLLLVLLRLALGAILPVHIICYLPHDDGWVMERAYDLLSGHWLGNYNQNTLIKGLFAPLLMAASRFVRIPFLLTNEILYVCACGYFTWCLSCVWKRRGVMIGVFAVLLFCPLSYALDTWQRPYRCGLCLWQLLFVFGALFSCACREELAERAKALHGALLGSVLWSFFNTREDGGWLWIPVLLPVGIALTGLLRRSDRGRKLMILLLPFVLVLLGNLVICAVNGVKYGGFVRNDRDAGAYAKAMKDLYLIDPGVAEARRFAADTYRGEYFNVYTSTVRKACAESPTLGSAEREIFAAIARWDACDGVLDGCPRNDMILFALRDGAADAGHYRSYTRAETFWGKVHEELQAAFATGRLKARGFALTALAAPFRLCCLRRFGEELSKAVRVVIGYENAGPAIKRTLGPVEWIQRYERMLLEPAVISDEAPRKERWMAVPRRICLVYSALGPWAAGLAILAFLVELWLMLTDGGRAYWRQVGFQAGVLAGLCAFVLAISYVSATTFPAVNYMYLCPAFVLALVFELTAIVTAGQMVVERIEKRKGAKR